MNGYSIPKVQSNDELLERVPVMKASPINTTIVPTKENTSHRSPVKQETSYQNRVEHPNVLNEDRLRPRASTPINTDNKQPFIAVSPVKNETESAIENQENIAKQEQVVKETVD